MKKAMPTIVLLITVSFLGLLFLQVFWIKNALTLQKSKYNNELEAAYRGIKNGLKSKIETNTGYKPSSVMWESDDPNVISGLWSEIANIPPDIINGIIEKELQKNHINLPFEFRITGSLLLTNSSLGFTSEMIPQSFQKTLTYDGSYIFYLYIRQPPNYILRRTLATIVTSMLFTLVIIAAFTITVRTVLRQKQLSEVKTDFINNMTHEFKTPLATISLAVDALGYDKVRANPQQIDYYSGIIREENNRMHKQVEKILQAAQLETQNLELNLQPLDLHQVIENAANNIKLRIEEKKGKLQLHFKARRHNFKMDEVHFGNIVANLLDNAIKYSREPVHIQVETSNPSSKTFVLKVKDNGIGMNKETAGQIFEKFYRAHTGNLHNVKGFGLGLSYVRSVVLAHHGKIRVDSTVGKGSTFIIELPVNV